MLQNRNCRLAADTWAARGVRIDQRPINEPRLALLSNVNDVLLVNIYLLQSVGMYNACMEHLVSGFALS